MWCCGCFCGGRGEGGGRYAGKFGVAGRGVVGWTHGYHRAGSDGGCDGYGGGMHSIAQVGEAEAAVIVAFYDGADLQD